MVESSIISEDLRKFMESLHKDTFGSDGKTFVRCNCTLNKQIADIEHMKQCLYLNKIDQQSGNYLKVF